MRVIFLSVIFAFCVISAIWAYKMNYNTRTKQKQIITINKKILNTENRIELLKAEWAFLNNPERLSKLVDENFLNLRLIPITKNSIISNLEILKKNNETSDD